MKLSVVILFSCVILCDGLSARQRLSAYQFESKNPLTFSLPRELKEVSGLATDETGRLFAHQDESGKVYQLDPSNGKIMKTFFIGQGRALREDFEDIAIVGRTFYLLSSAGDLYEFLEAENKGQSRYTVYHTGLSRSNNVEGLCYDASAASLLLACKAAGTKKYKDERCVYRFSLREKKLDTAPLFTISLSLLEDSYGLKDFTPTAITREPQTGNYFVLSSHVPSLIELSPAGEVVDCVKLAKEIHPQPEGMVILPDHTLLISDEGARKGRIVTYGLRK